MFAYSSQLKTFSCVVLVSLFDPTKFQGFLLCICRRCVFTVHNHHTKARLDNITDDDVATEDDNNHSLHVFMYPLFGLRGRMNFAVFQRFLHKTRVCLLPLTSSSFFFAPIYTRNSTITHDTKGLRKADTAADGIPIKGYYYTNTLLSSFSSFTFRN